MHTYVYRCTYIYIYAVVEHVDTLFDVLVGGQLVAARSHGHLDLSHDKGGVSYAYICICMHVCMYIYIYLSIYVYIYSLSPPEPTVTLT